MFVCCPEKQAKKRNNVMNDLKQLVEAVEDKLLVPCTFVGCPVFTPPAPVAPEPAPLSPPDIMVCYKCEKVEKSENRRNAKKPNQRRVKRAKSRELRASILYRGCSCEKRDGLQDDCRRTGCQGSPECLTKPEPICGPSEFSNAKHLGRKQTKTRQGAGGNDEDGEHERNAKTTTYYNCYPATVKVS